MNVFRFRLQSILDLRTRKEDGLKKDFSLALEALYAEEERLKALNRDLEAQLAQWDAEANGRTDISDFVMYDQYLAHLKKRILGQIRQIKVQQEKTETVRLDLVEATKDKRVLERLKERHYTDYRNRLDRLEQKFLDEIGTRKYYDQTMINS